MKRSNSFIIWVVFLIFSPLVLASAGSDIPEKATRTFQLRNRELSEITSKIKPLLSPEGSILIKPQDQQIVVDDFLENIEAIARLIQQLDIPPRQIKLDIYFIHAAKGSGKKSISFELREMAAKLGSFLNYDDYQLIDKHRIMAKEGEISSLQLGEQYIISFYTQFTYGVDRVIRLKNFRLFKREKLSNGRYRLKKLIVTSINLVDGAPFIIGASSSEESEEALIMALTAFIAN